MLSLRRLAISCVALLWAASAQAGSVTIDFDPDQGFPIGMPNTNTPVPAADKITTLNATSAGVTDVLTFTSVGGSGFAALVNLGLGHAPSGVNGIGAADNAGNLTYGLPIQVAFSLATNFVSITGDNFPIPPGGSITLTAFNAANVQIASVTVPDSGGAVLSISRSTSDINSIRFSSTVNTVAFDNLTLNVVPEPTSVVMGLGGLVGVLGMVRRQRRLARNAA